MTVFTPGKYHIELNSGAYLDLAKPSPVMTLDDVAHGLSHVCRFAGQTNRFYSVAEHACIVADKLRHEGRTPRVIFGGLHHDDTEAFLGDVTRPLKLLLRDYADLEATMAMVIAEALQLPFLSDEEEALVKAADDWALAVEAYKLLPSMGESWFCEGLFTPPHFGSLLPRALFPVQAKKNYLFWHHYWAPRAAE